MRQPLRLTLRTLLAYLDDMLEPEQARDIGARVAESEMARELVERIRKVTRRRRLSSPPLLSEGEGDPNLVAEYLDNVLSPQEVAEVEERCLQSDLYLAELASCHQILSLVVGEPAYVPPTARSRMYGLVRGRESFPNRTPPPTPTPPQIGELDDRDDERFALPSEKSKRGRVIASMLGLALALAAAVWFALPTPPEARTGSNDYALAKPKTTLPTTDKVKDGDKDKGTPKSTGQVKTEPKTEPKTKLDTEPKGVDPVDPDPKKNEPVVEPKPKETEPKPKENEPKVIEKQPLLRKPIPAPSQERKELGPLTTKETIVLSRKSDTDPWFRVLPTKTVSSNQDVLALPGYRSTLELNSGVSLTFWGYLPDYIPDPRLLFEVKSIAYTDLESKARLHVPPPGYAADVTLQLGRFIVSNRKGENHRVIVRFQNQAWDLLLRDKDTEVVLSLISVYDPGVLFSPDGVGDPPRVTLDCWLSKGRAGLIVGDREPIELSRAGNKIFVTWDNRDAGLTIPESPPKIDPLVDPDLPLPPYAEPAKRALKKLSSLLAAPRDDFALALTEVMSTIKAPTPKDKSAELPLSILAVLAQAAMGDLGRVVEAAGIDDFPTRQAALLALRHISHSSPKADLQIYEMLGKRGYADIERKMFVSLLHEYDKQQMVDPQIHAGLLEGLRSRKIAIRDLAFSHTQYFFERASPGASINLAKFYTPDMPESKRLEGLEVVEDAFKQLPLLFMKKN